MSTLPVRSPLPNRVASTRSAPASRPISAVATPVPRSLWGWREMMALSREGSLRMKYSSMSANWLGMQFSTVVGRFRITLFSGVAWRWSSTAWQISTA